MTEKMRNLTKLTYLACLLGLVFIPLVVWAQDPTNVDLAGVGAFAGGTGVPLGILTASMAYKRTQGGGANGNQ